MAEVQQDQQYRLLLHLFFSEKPLDINVISDSCITNQDRIYRQGRRGSCFPV
ncbi:hypothetical protein BDV36DRAFT_278304 [Aspergillus pseudocaelatus]|uniref:Uncharacterized protein n=1 Tax=Aspergillus pseudocaelatus TaxID=1825620 RepID=A0ABQ6W4L0_9EURO|nr:hypothetical protein BDV36DRAFT_278304 [Aspergillus pseudocaelatus]